MEKLLKLIFPEKCIFCGQFGDVFCVECLKKCKVLMDSFCIVCDKVSIGGSTHEKCMDIQNTQESVHRLNLIFPSRLITLFSYEKNVISLDGNIKFSLCTDSCVFCISMHFSCVEPPIDTLSQTIQKLSINTLHFLRHSTQKTSPNCPQNIHFSGKISFKSFSISYPQSPFYCSGNISSYVNL